jgi:hypothetical protein
MTIVSESVALLVAALAFIAFWLVAMSGAMPDLHED